MKYYYFVDLSTERTFVVGAQTVQEAMEEALVWHITPKYLGEVSKEWVDRFYYYAL